MIEVNPTSSVPLYRQIVEQVRRLVALGALRPGDRLPTVRELAARARVNRNTAARAIQLLEADGLVRTRVGQGTFVEQVEIPADRSASEAVLDEKIDALLFDAHTRGVPLEELGWRLSRRIEAFRRRREESAAAGRSTEEEA
jgi:GntR family transcriptional regulator